MRYHHHRSKRLEIKRAVRALIAFCESSEIGFDSGQSAFGTLPTRFYGSELPGINGLHFDKR
jgi:hypothetical protein